MPDVDEPVHKYVPASAGCWQTFVELQADEAARVGCPSAHRVVVAAYMAQHPGDGNDCRYVLVHLIGHCAVLEHEVSHQCVTKLLGQVIRRRRGDLPVLLRTDGPGSLTVLHMVGAANLDDSERRAREWAAAAWGSSSAQHDLIRTTLHSVLDSACT